MAKAKANLAALVRLRDLAHTGRPAEPADQAVLARWSGWGALAGVFDVDNDRWADERAQLRGLLDDRQWAAARRTVLNAHYTDASVAGAIWQLVTGLGLTGGRVLEPGCGAGNFIGLAPASMEMVGVELDPTTAAIARHLYPDAEVHTQGFEATRFPVGSFDAAVGNVPFGNYRLVDPFHNRDRHRIHNHFVIKSLDLVRPGGLVAVITSRYTLDAASRSARDAMHARADLVGAVRLPAGTFHASAGTNVICDIVVLRRRDPDLPAPESPGWLDVDEAATPTGTVRLNHYFIEHPNHIVGDLEAGRGQYRDDDLIVRRPEDLPGQLTGALGAVVERARREGLTVSAQPLTPTTERGPAAPARWREGSIHRDGHRFVTVTGGHLEPFSPAPAKDAAELGLLVDLRDVTAELLAAQARLGNDDEFTRHQDSMARTYERYVGRYGPINRYRLARTGRADPDTGDERMRKLWPKMGGFRADPDLPLVMALERYDPDTGQAKRAAIFSQRVVAPRSSIVRTDEPAGALAVSLDTAGTVDLDRIAALLDTTPGDARRKLGALVWDDPATGQLEPASVYLSGNVRTKLADARRAAAGDAGFDANVAALTAVVPPDLGPEQIDARPGATWIPATDVADFVIEVLGASRARVEYEPTLALWTFTVDRWDRRGVTMTSEWGTERVSAVDLLDAAANQRPVVVYDTLADGRRVLNAGDTLDARAKQDQLIDRFSEWVWADPARAERLAAVYNETFNSTVTAHYDGSHLSLPGLVEGFVPFDHQRSAVWRILSEPTVLLGHEVGAGKTATMVTAAMELRRLGLASKPALVVPNHMLEQIAREAQQLYPQASLLVAGADDVSASHRERFVARAATGDWDAVIITHSAFERIPVSPDAIERFVTEDLDELRTAKTAATERLTVKALEKAIARRETRLDDLLARDHKDDGVTFEATGIDYLFADEAHLFKNLENTTRIRELAKPGSKRATDLHLKLRVLREHNGDRVATLATATPIANSIAEMHVMQRYLQPDALRAAGVASFDAWAATFGRTVTQLELAPDGGGYRMNTRFARFTNVPELAAMFGQVADMRSADDLGLEVPSLTGNGPDTVVIDATDTLRSYVASLFDRADQVRNRAVTPDVDNMLKITGDGQRAALDLRLVGLQPEAPTKAATVADRVARIHHGHVDDMFHDPATGEPETRRGALQLVFCDLSTPQPGRWSFYRELRDELVARGVPAESIRFVHDAKSDQAKAELFQACRDGRVAVLMGSTAKMGVGTNVQTRAVALHHVDCPWRPADLAQREGRIVRQGNQYDQVHIVRYATEASFDVYSWQTVERKARFIAQVSSGTVTDRSIDDTAENALSYAEVKALASGNPLVIEQAQLAAELAKLTRAADAHWADQARLRRLIDSSDRSITHQSAVITSCDTAIRRRVDTSADKFTMTIGPRVHRSRAEAGTDLKAILGGSLTEDFQPVGALGGFDWHARRTSDGYLDISSPDAPLLVTLERRDLTGDPVGLVRRLEHAIGGLDRHRAQASEELRRAREQRDLATERLGIPFADDTEITRLRRRLAEIDLALQPPDDLPSAVERPDDTSDQARAPGPESSYGPSRTPIERQPSRRPSHGVEL